MKRITILSRSKRVGIAFAFQLFLLCAHAEQTDFAWTSKQLQAIDCIYQYKLEKATEFLANDDQVASVYLVHMVDYYTLLGNQSYEDFKRRLPNQQKHLQRMRSIPQASPLALYTQAEIHLHWAVLKLMHEEFVSGAKDLRTAWNLIQKNQQLFPNYKSNLKTLGFINAVLGTLPDQFHWMLKVVGMYGNYQQGFAQIESYIQSCPVTPATKLEWQSAQFYHTLLQFYFGNRYKSWESCEAFTNDYATNPLHCYLRGFIAARTGNNDEAILVLSKAPKGNEYGDFFELDYQLGLAKLNRLDEDAAIGFKKFVTFYKGKLHKRDAYQKLAWISWLAGDTLHYKVYRKMANSYGAADDEDRAVDKEQATGIFPSAGILRMRLLFDGGYYKAAEDACKQINAKALPSIYQRGEFAYRAGRLMQEYGKYAKALTYFSQAIEQTQSTNYEFAPMSCLQMGNVYIQLRYYDLAKLYFEQALTYKNYDAKGYVAQRVRMSMALIPAN